MSATLIDGVVFTVEIGFSTTAGTNRVPLGSTLASINWTDVSAYVRNVSTSRGRSSELDTFQTGSASIVFSNADRRFDPEYTAGPYYGALTPLRPVRIRAQYGAGATTNLFFGWIEQWPQTYDNPTDATVTVTASDGFKVLNLITLPSYWEYQVRTDGPTAWFRFDDGTAPTTAFESISALFNGVWKTNAGAATTGASSESLVVDDTSVSALFDGTDFIEIPQASFTFGFTDYLAKTVECWISTTTTTNGSYGIFYKPGYEFTVAIGMIVAGGVGTIQGQWGTVGGVNLTNAETSAVTVNDGKPHHILLRWDYNTSAHQLWVDGVLATTSTSFSNSEPTETNIVVGKAYTSSATSTYNMASGFVGTIDELAFYNTKALTTTQIANHYAIGVGTYGAGQRTDQRISDVLNMAQWMTDGTDLNTGSGTVQAIATQGKNPLALAQESETAEQGRLFIDRDGKVEFISRNALATTSTYNTSQYTFGDSTGELGYTSLQFEFNDRLIFNRSVVGRSNGPTATFNDTTSQGQYFIRTSDVTDLIVDTDQQIIDIANARLSAYAQPKLRVEQLTFTPRQSPVALYPVAIGVEIGTRITVNRRPQGVGSLISKQVIVEGISHTITPDGWETTFTLSPVFVATFILDSATFGVLDSNQLGY
jgi:hypothetical protein